MISSGRNNLLKPTHIAVVLNRLCITSHAGAQEVVKSPLVSRRNQVAVLMIFQEECSMEAFETALGTAAPKITPKYREDASPINTKH